MGFQRIDETPEQTAAKEKQAAAKKVASNAAVVQPSRIPPHSAEAEQGILGCILLDPKKGLELCARKIQRGSELFYDMRHQVLFDTLIEMHGKNEEIDPIGLQQYLRDRNQLDSIGGLPYISSLMNCVPGASSLEYYIDIVREKFVLRNTLALCASTTEKIYTQPGEIDELMDEIDSGLSEISKERADAFEITPVKALVHGAINTIETYHINQGKLSGLATGFADLDRLTHGLQPEMIVIAARPSAGKTSLAMNIAEHVAIEERQPVGVFSLEMSKESLVLRMVCSRGRLNLKNVRDGFLAERDFPKITAAAGKISAAPIYIDDTSALTVQQLQARAARMTDLYGIKLFVVDYLQLLTGKGKDRQQVIAEISGGIKAMTKDLGVPVITIAQLSREIEKDKHRKPRLADLRESGAIEQDADLVGMLYKAIKDDPEDDQAQADCDAVPVNLLIAKNRNGPTGEVSLIFMKSFTRFESASRIAPDAHTYPTTNDA